MKSRTTARFRSALARLPDHVRRQPREAYKMFVRDPYHPGLRFKKVHSRLPIYSVRINIDHRAVGIIEGDVVIWFWIGSHADYEKILKQM